MTATVSGLWRHPIKSHGREEVAEVHLSAGQTMPGDRIWAVAHEKSTADGREWVPCANFSRVSKAPELMAITARLESDASRVTLYLDLTSNWSLKASINDNPEVTVFDNMKGDLGVDIAWEAQFLPAASVHQPPSCSVPAEIEFLGFE